MPKRFPAGTTPVRSKLARILRVRKGEWVEVDDVAVQMYGVANLTTRKRCTALINLIRKDGTTPYVIDTWYRGRTSKSYYRLRDRQENESGIIGSDADFLRTNLPVVQESIRRMSIASNPVSKQPRRRKSS